MTVRHSVVALLLSLTFTAAHAGFLEDFYDSSSGAGQANVTAAGIYESAHLNIVMWDTKNGPLGLVEKGLKSSTF